MRQRWGEPAWYPVATLPEPEVLECLPLLLPRLRSARERGAIVYGRHEAGAGGVLRQAFTEAPGS